MKKCDSRGQFWFEGLPDELVNHLSSPVALHYVSNQQDLVAYLEAVLYEQDHPADELLYKNVI